LEIPIEPQGQIISSSVSDRMLKGKNRLDEEFVIDGAL